MNYRVEIHKDKSFRKKIWSHFNNKEIIIETQQSAEVTFLNDDGSIDQIIEYGYILPEKIQAALPVQLENGMYHCQGRLVVYYMRGNILEGGDLGKTDRMCAGVTQVAEKFKSFDMNSKISLLATILENYTMLNFTLPDCTNILQMISTMKDYSIRQLQLPQLDDIKETTYGGRDTYEVDFASCRQKLQAFLMGE